MGHGRGQLVLKRSPDGGLSWSERLPVPRSWSTALQVPTIYKCIDPQGATRLLVFTGHYPIRCSHSDDQGLTWTEFQPLGDFGGNVSMSDVIRLKSGHYMAFFHDDGRCLYGDKRDVRLQLFHSTTQDTHKVELFRSTRSDGGKSWSHPVLADSSAYTPPSVT